MRIVVKEPGSHIRLRFPTAMVFNRFTAAAISKESGKHGVKVTPEQVRGMIKAVNAYRRTHPDWVLAEVHSTNGRYVFVKL